MANARLHTLTQLQQLSGPSAPHFLTNSLTRPLVTSGPSLGYYMCPSGPCYSQVGAVQLA